jgi:hypothetical protein
VTRAKQKKRSRRQKKPSVAMVPAPRVIPPEPPPVVVDDDARGRRRAYVRAPVRPETVEALEGFVESFGRLFSAIDRELRRFSRR